MPKVPITWGGTNPLTGQPFRWGEFTWGGFIEIPDNTTHMQNLIDLSSITEQDWTDVDAAFDIIDAKFGSKMLDLTVEQRRRLTKMGDKSEAFCRQTLVVSRQNEAKLPTDTVTELGVEEIDLANLEKVRLRLTRLKALTEKAEDTEMALGSDIMVFCLAAYGLLKAIGAGAGLDALRAQMSARFAKAGKPDSGSGTGGNPA